jgi:endonuclease-8
MNGSWHRYRPGERWRRPVGRARLVLEVPGVRRRLLRPRSSSCSNSVPRRSIHRSGNLGRISWPIVRPGEAMRRPARPGAAPGCRSPGRCSTSARWRASATSTERDPVDRARVAVRRVGELDDDTLGRLVATAQGLLLANVAPGTAPNASRRPGDRGAPGRCTSTAGPAARATLPDADRAGQPGERHPTIDLLVPDLPGRAASADVRALRRAGRRAVPA